MADIDAIFARLHLGRWCEPDRRRESQQPGSVRIYDIDLGGDFTPYVGGRLGVNKLKYSAGYAASGERFSSSQSKTKTGVGLLLGVNYKLSEEMALDAGYRYNHMDKDINAHEFSVGLRYYF